MLQLRPDNEGLPCLREPPTGVLFCLNDQVTRATAFGLTMPMPAGVRHPRR
jgi:hypothetical protein